MVLTNIFGIDFELRAKFKNLQGSPNRVYRASKNKKDVAMVTLLSGNKVSVNFDDTRESIIVQDESCRFSEYMLSHAAAVINCHMDPATSRIVNHERNVKC